jgi:hypothetical protein
MDGQRLADALAYEQERRRRLANVVPMPASGQPEVAPTPSLRSNLENLSIGLGEGLTNQLEGVRALVTDPIGSAKGAYEGMVAAVRDPSIIADALRYTAQQASSGPLGAGEVIGEMVGPMRTRGTPVMQEIDVYHGSPHRFEEFDASKIGTGEGAQAYGHGIYLAESPDVARTYIPKGRDLSGFTLRETGEFIGKDDPRFPEIADTMDRMVKNGYGERFSEQFSTHSGALYTADLPDEMVDRMLDWDKPLSEQPKVLRALLNSDDEWKAYTAQLSPKSRKLAEDMAVGAKPNTGDEAFKLFKQLDADNPNADHNAIYDVIRKYNPRTTDQDWIMSMMSGSAAPGAGIRGGGGADLYNTLGGGEQAAQRLRAAGIPGMQYLDAGSRGQGGSGTRNFVVFPGEEKKVTILSRD